MNPDFKLDTSNMDATAKLCSDLAECMRNLRHDLDNCKTSLMERWDGSGGSAFNQKYYTVVQQLKDLTQKLWDMSESIYAAEESYIQVDVDAAKQMDGVEKPG